MIQLDFRKNCLNRLSKILFRLGKTTYWKEWYSISADLFSFYARTIDMSIILEKDERFVKDEQIRRYIDKCFDDFHAKAQGLPPFSKQYSSQHNRIDSSYRDIKLCILAPRFVYNDKRYIECEFENYFVKTALEVGIQAEIFHTDLISYPNLIKDAGLAQIRLQELRDYVAKIRPHVILFDANYIGSQNTINPYLLNELQQITGARIVAFLADAWGDQGRNMIHYWAEQSDLLLHIAPGGLSDLGNPIAAKTVLIPLPLDHSIFYKGRTQSFDISFVGSYVGALRPFWLSHIMKIATQHSMTKCMIPHARLAHECPDFDEFARILRHSRIAMNFSSRVLTGKNSTTRILTGRAWQAIAAGCLLFEEENEPIKTFFTPFVHYVPFANVAQLKAFLLFFTSHEDYRKRIADAGNDWYNTWYSNERIWSYILARLGFSTTFG